MPDNQASSSDQNNPSPGWAYTPDAPKKSADGMLNIDHSKDEQTAPVQEPVADIPAEAEPAPPPQHAPVAAKPEPAPQAEVNAPGPVATPEPIPAEPNKQDFYDSTADSGGVSWTASEYIHHEKGTGWYVILFLGAILLSGLMYLITKDIATAVILIILAGIVAGFATRKPSNVEYRVAGDGVHIGQKFYPFNIFKSYSIIQDEGLRSINLTPLKRFMPPISMYYAPDDEPKIVEILGERLPQAQGKPEAVDRLARRLKF